MFEEEWKGKERTNVDATVPGRRYIDRETSSFLERGKHEESIG